MTTYLWFLTHWWMTPNDKESDYIRHEIWMNMRSENMYKIYRYIQEILAR